MHRFYIESPDIQENLLSITDRRIVHQLGKVLRMWKGDKFSVFDEKGREWSVEIIDLNRHQALTNVLEEVKNQSEAKVKVALFQAIPKKPALFELVVQKATELGAAEIYPLITERTEKRRLGKFDRLFKIAMEATEQCGGTRIPLIHHPVALENIPTLLTRAYVAYEYAKGKGLLDYQEQFKEGELQIIIGPEGGFSEKEIGILKKAGVKTFTLGPRILRTETAAIAALSLILAR